VPSLRGWQDHATVRDAMLVVAVLMVLRAVASNKNTRWASQAVANTLVRTGCHATACMLPPCPYTSTSCSQSFTSERGFHVVQNATYPSISAQFKGCLQLHPYVANGDTCICTQLSTAPKLTAHNLTHCEAAEQKRERTHT
jgi:hypothetical protein